MAKFWWIRSDPCGLFSALLTVFLILYAQYVVVTVVLLPWYGFNYHVVLYSLSSLLALIAHTRSQYMEPGCVPRDHAPPVLPADLHKFIDPRVPLPPGPRICKVCKTIKPIQAYHCSLCDRCIMRMDHHCPWVNNCVGMHNQKYFMLFLFWTGVCCIYSGALLIARFMSCSNNSRQCTISGVGTALCIANFVEALVFGLFVIVMLFDQFSAIFDGTALVQDHRPTAPAPPVKPKYEALRGVFGEPFGLTWFLPIDMPKKMKEDFHTDIRASAEAAERAAVSVRNVIENRRKMFAQSMPQQQQQQFSASIPGAAMNSNGVPVHFAEHMGAGVAAAAAAAAAGAAGAAANLVHRHQLAHSAGANANSNADAGRNGPRVAHVTSAPFEGGETYNNSDDGDESQDSE